MRRLTPFPPVLRRRPIALPTVAAGVALLLGACEPTIKLQAPDKPIVINLNVRIEQEVRVKVEREIDELIREEKGVF